MDRNVLIRKVEGGYIIEKGWPIDYKSVRTDLDGVVQVVRSYFGKDLNEVEQEETDDEAEPS